MVVGISLQHDHLYWRSLDYGLFLCILSAFYYGCSYVSLFLLALDLVLAFDVFVSVSVSVSVSVPVPFPVPVTVVFVVVVV